MRPAAWLLLALAAAVSAAEMSDAAKSWWTHVEYLASDALEGRRTGTPGHIKAAEYVAAQFQRIGLKPAGTKGYLQAVSFVMRKVDESKSTLSLIRNGKETPLKLGEHAYFALRGDSGKAVEAEAVFVGYGLVIPEAGHDDTAGLDLKNKIVVYLSGAPSGVSAELSAHYQTGAERWGALKRAGAIGVAVIENPKLSDVPWERSSLRRLTPAMTLADPDLVDSAGQRVALTINSRHADQWLDGTGHSTQELLELAVKREKLPRFTLPVRVRAKAVFDSSGTVSHNVAGVIPGSDPKLKDEVIVLSAHLDHLGIGTEPVAGDSIYNGAMDNASGVASVIEIAKELAAKKPKRSVAFVAVTGEESGLLGSKYFAAHPSLGRARIVANVNLDMFLPLFPLDAVVPYGADESDLGPLFEKVAAAAGVKVARDREPLRRVFVRSDQYSFIRRGIPALSFKFDAEPGTGNAEKYREWIKTRYHAPSDDLQQPLDKEAAVKFNSLLLSFTEAVANRTEVPRWNEKSFFRRYAEK